MKYVYVQIEPVQDRYRQEERAPWTKDLWIGLYVNCGMEAQVLKNPKLEESAVMSKSKNNINLFYSYYFCLQRLRDDFQFGIML